MDVFDAIGKRRSIRKFRKTGIRMDLIEELVDAARMAPSAMNKQPLEYIAVNISPLLEKVFDCTEWKNYSFEAGPEKGEEPKAYLVVVSKGLRQNSVEVDAGLAMENIMLGAVAKGLSSCCLGAIDRQKLQRILGVPQAYRVNYVVALGYPAQESETVDAENEEIHSANGTIKVSKMPLGRIIHRNGF